jgi:hypothetical protein
MNLAAISYSDLVLDIDRMHDDEDYHASICGQLAEKVASALDFSDLKKFGRYYEFESFEVESVCEQVAASARDASDTGRLEDAIVMLSREAPRIPVPVGVELLLSKLNESMTAMTQSRERRYMSAEEWRAIAERNHKVWFNPLIRNVAEHVYPLAAPVVWAARRAAFRN